MELDWRIIFVTVLILAAVFWQRQIGELFVQAKEALYSRVAFLGTSGEELEAEDEVVTSIDMEALQTLGSPQESNDSLAQKEEEPEPGPEPTLIQQEEQEGNEPEVAGIQTKPTEVFTGVGGSERTREDVLIEIQFEVDRIQEEVEELSMHVAQLQEAQAEF